MSLVKLQEKIGVNPDGIFGPTTLKRAMNFFNLSPERTAHFFGQVSHETGGFKVFTENLNYSADGLQKTFPKYFPGSLELEYAGKPVKIASRVYANRMGNGNEESQDGWLYRGRGALQTTGKNNYKALAIELNKPEILTNPDLVATNYAFQSAFFYFKKNNLWAICDLGVNDKIIKQLTKKINGGTNGLNDRIIKTKQYYKWLTE